MSVAIPCLGLVVEDELLLVRHQLVVRPVRHLHVAAPDEIESKF